MRTQFRKLGVRILLAVLALACASSADDAPPSSGQGPQLKRQIDQFVRGLNADRAAERDAAEQQLLELAGTTTAENDHFLALLPRDSDQMPLAVRDRLGRIRRQVEGRVSKSAAIGSTVTLTAKDMPLSEVWKTIEQQTGNRFIDNREDQPEPGEKETTVSIALQNEPFWPAVDRVLDEAQLGIYSYGGEEALSIVGRAGGDAPRVGRANYQGPFRLEVMEAQAQRNLRQPRLTSLVLRLEIAWEPRLRPIAFSQPLADIQVTTDSGGQLAINEPDAVRDVEVPSGTQAAEIELPFALPTREVKKIALLRGKLRALVPGRHVKFQFADVTKAARKSQRLGGVQVTLDDVRKNGAVWEVHMRFALDEANGALQSHRNWVFQNLSYLVGKDDQRIESAGFETTRQTPNEVGVAYLFDATEGLTGLTWVYETPASIVDVPVEYELKDIELP